MTINYIGEKRECYIALLKRRLKPQRFEHTLRTEAKALELAQRFGEYPARTQTAALLHDILKNASKEENEALMSKYNITPQEGGENLLHGLLTACYISDELGVTDEDIINAVRNHTAGRAGMSRLEKIIYLADLIEDGRDFPHVEELRSLAEDDLDKAVYAACAHTIAYLVSVGSPILGGTIELYNDYALKERKDRR